MAHQVVIETGDEGVPFLGDGLRFIKRSASHEPLPSNAAFLSDDESEASVAGEKAAITPKSRRSQRQTASDDGTPTSAFSSGFLLGSSTEDDVFTQASAETAPRPPAPNPGKKLQIYEENAALIDAQGIFPGTACMFVANLSQPHDDKLLHLEVTKAFSQFGQVWVKIKRDSKQMPFAFCQFTEDDNAHDAVKFGKGMIILGRPCRTEMARAHSSFVVEKRSGEPIGLAEASALLGQLGEVAKAEYLRDDVQAFDGFPRAAIVTYKMYDSKRDPVRFFAENLFYRVVSNDPKIFPATNGLLSPVATWSDGQQRLDQYGKDGRSAFVGNLPLTMTRERLSSIASECGEVRSVDLYKKNYPGLNGSAEERKCFAFVEFAAPGAAEDLVTSMNDSMIEKHRVIVQPKKSRAFDTPQRGPPSQLRHVRSTIPRRRGSGFFNGIQAESDAVYSPTANIGDASGNMAQGDKSLSWRRMRRPKSMSFQPNMSLTEHQACPRDTTSHDVSRCESPNRDTLALAASCNGTSVSVTTGSTGPVADGLAASPATPKFQGPMNAVDNHLGIQGGSVPMSMAWMPTYAQCGYPYMGGAPITPQGGPGFMYSGYMGPPCFGPLVDMYGNLVMSPAPVMSPYTTTYTPANMANTTCDAVENAMDSGEKEHQADN